ncbi:MAG: nuclear transport factor 2 family protein [bacterium]|nr:nuclear transport factor 2 family protein [Gammaproteobacteria bacterium]
MSSLEERVQNIEDRDEIRELTTRYCHAIAAADVNCIIDLFCEDGAFCTGDRTTKGTAALEKFYSSLSKQPPIPFIQNHVVDEISGDHARARCSAEIRMVADGKSVTTAGWYEDTFRKVDGKWKFAERKFNVFHMVPLSEGWA